MRALRLIGKKDAASELARSDNLPGHVAIIMDGNGRWASKRGLPRVAGHRKGAESVRQVVRSSAQLGIKYVTLYAFSSENWSRPAMEVKALMELFAQYMRRETTVLAREGIRLRFIGERAALNPEIQSLMTQAEAHTVDGERMTLVIAVNYGARDEILAAVREIAKNLSAGAPTPENLTHQDLSNALMTANLPDPDLIIRTSGEQRLSNFLLWQAAYAEFVFAPELWPDFDQQAYFRCLQEFSSRKRRFGHVAG